MIERRVDGSFKRRTIDTASKVVVNLIAFHGFARGVPKTRVGKVVSLLRGMRRWSSYSLEEVEELVLALDGAESSFYLIRVDPPFIWLE